MQRCGNMPTWTVSRRQDSTLSGCSLGCVMLTFGYSRCCQLFKIGQAKFSACFIDQPSKQLFCSFVEYILIANWHIDGSGFVFVPKATDKRLKSENNFIIIVVWYWASFSGSSSRQGLFSMFVMMIGTYSLKIWGEVFFFFGRALPFYFFPAASSSQQSDTLASTNYKMTVYYSKNVYNSRHFHPVTIALEQLDLASYSQKPVLQPNSISH